MNPLNTFIDKNSNTEINELWLQYLWKKNAFTRHTLYTTTGKPLRILFPGWFNKGWGPDFKEARILIDDDCLFGDIEIHVDEAAWTHHAHHQSAPYNKVILHVYLNRSETPARNSLDQLVPALYLKSTFLESFWKTFSVETGFRIVELPGACGLSLDGDSTKHLKSIIQQAAETRLVDKAQPFIEEIKQNDLLQSENILFMSICKSLGYSAHSEQLVMLARLFPYSSLKQFFRGSHRQRRIDILSRWLGYLGLFDQYDINMLHQDLRKEWLTLKQNWDQINRPSISPTLLKKTPFRPYNNPVRRLIGLYYHLKLSCFKGLIGTWLRFLNHCHEPVASGKKRSAVLESLTHMFPQPDWDPFSYLTPQSKNPEFSPKTRFIGQQKQLIILVNSIIPFFLAWSRIHNNRKLEKLLFKLLLVLPGEGKNRKISFMENRLLKDNNLIKIKKNLSYCQGLIQIHDDCCTSFYEGCRHCSLLRLLHGSD